MLIAGTIGQFHWIESLDRDLDIPAVVSHLAEFLGGLTAVNVSWDSGEMPLSIEQEAAGWRRVLGHAVSPVLTEALMNSWPKSACQSGRYDEWYLFREPGDVAKLVPFCNYSISLSESKNLEFPDGVNLGAQLERSCPEVVIGEGENLYVIARDQRLLSRFAAMTPEA
jgi:hypothetical protein